MQRTRYACLQMPPDGNCLFHSVADQLYGDSGSYAKVRKEVVDHMVANEDFYAPFMENDEAFSSYASRMRKVRLLPALRRPPHSLCIARSSGRLLQLDQSCSAAQVCISAQIHWCAGWRMGW